MSPRSTVSFIIAAVLACVLTVVFIECSEGCCPTPAREPEARPRFVDAGSCALACSNLAGLGCPEGETPDGGLPCVEVCETSLRLHLAPLPAECVARAASVASARACGVKCQH